MCVGAGVILVPAISSTGPAEPYPRAFLTRIDQRYLITHPLNVQLSELSCLVKGCQIRILLSPQVTFVLQFAWTHLDLF